MSAIAAHLNLSPKLILIGYMDCSYLTQFKSIQHNNINNSNEAKAKTCILYLLSHPALSRYMKGSPAKKKTLSWIKKLPRHANWKSLKCVIKYCITKKKKKHINIINRDLAMVEALKLILNLPQQAMHNASNSHYKNNRPIKWSFHWENHNIQFLTKIW